MKILIIMISLVTHSLLASIAPRNMVKVEAIGSSGKGQFVAIEQYGYSVKDKRPYSIIKIMNVWKKQYVQKPIIIRGKKIKKQELDRVRAKARYQARAFFKRYGISG